MTAIHLVTDVPGPGSRALGEIRRRCVSRGVSEPGHGVFFARGEGARLTDVDGNTFLDLAGGIGCLNAGHGANLVVDAARSQLDALQHGCFMVAPYAAYVTLAERLCARVPVGGEARAAFFNSGAEAVENAVKIARRATGRPAVICFDPGFHGRTLLTMSLTSKSMPYKEGFGPFAPEVYRFPLPDVYRRPAGLGEAAFVAGCIDDFHRFLKSVVSPSSVACVVLEPVLGEGGFLVPPRAFVDDVAATCRAHGILFVADEVQSGICRTGRFLACEHFGLHPDLVTLAKSLSNGLPLGAVVGRAEVMDAVHPGGLGGTFGGNPVACAAALGVLDTVDALDLCGRATRIGARLDARFAAWMDRFPFLGDARGLGAMKALEIVRDRPGRAPDKARVDAILALAAQRGVLALSAGLYGNVIRFLVPLVIADAELEEALDVLEGCLRDTPGA